MSSKLQKKWALILGGSSGLGLATALKLSKNGYAICVVHRDRRNEMKRIEKQFEEIRSSAPDCFFFNLDATNPDKRKEVIEALRSHFNKEDRVKVLVHSIAKGSLKPMFSTIGQTLTTEDFEITFRAMALSLYEWVKDLVEHKIIDPDMRVISFTSEGNRKVMPGYAAVSVAKVALEALTRSIAVEFAPLGIKANCVQAGVTDTFSFGKIPNSDQIRTYALKRNPMGRITTPEDVANTVFLLCSDDAGWINGTIVNADGGESLR